QWVSAKLLQVAPSRFPNLLIGDIDNNGALDIVAGDQVFLNDGKAFAPLPAKLAGAPQAISGASGLLNILALNSAGEPVELMNRGSKHYHWQVIRTRAAQAIGDQRINSFG